MPHTRVDDTTPAKVGECQMGAFEIIDWDTHTVRQVSIMVDLPAGWRTSETAAPPEELLTDPVFIDPEHFQCVLPAREIQVYSIGD